MEKTAEAKDATVETGNGVGQKVVFESENDFFFFFTSFGFCFVLFCFFFFP